MIGRRQLIQRGVGVEAIRYRVASGALTEVFPGAYAVAVPLSPEATRMAALLSTAPSFLSHRDAAEHHSLVDPIPGPVHVTVARRRNLKRLGIVVHRTTHLHADDRWVRGPMRVTSPARTLVDIAGSSTKRQLTRAYDEARRLGMVAPGDVIRACERSGGRPGTGVLLDLAREALPAMERTRSWAEALFLRFCREEGIPSPAVNVPLLGFEVDFFWPDAGVVVEMDSGHHDSPRSRDDDVRRDARLAAAGYRVYRVRSRRLEAEPEAVAGELRQLTALDYRR